MHTIRTRRLMREFCGPDTGTMSSSDRETVVPVSLAIGVVVVVLLAGCQRSVVPLTMMPATLTPVFAAAEDATSWISKAHAQAARDGSGEHSLDMSY